MSESLIGRLLDDRYQIIREIGDGAVGSVYLGRQVAVDRQVAVKVLHRGGPSFSSAVGRFLEEARAASNLHHPNVVTVHDFGRTSDGMLYLVMEYLDGVTLGRMLEAGPLAPDRVVDIGVQICSGLGAAHARGIVHRDLKPENVMLCQVEGFGPLAKLLDFGIAKSLMLNTRRTADGVALGTPLYMSPEQASGRPVGFASDLYSLGVVLYEMLVGQPPFDDEDPLVVLDAHCHTPPPDVARAAPWPIPEALADVTMRCLAKQPSDRPNSVAAVRAVLADLLPSRRPVPTAPAPDTTVSHSPGTTAEDPPEAWRAGRLIDQRFRVERVQQTVPATVVLAADTQAPDQPLVTLRRIPLPPGLNRDFLELAVDQHLALLTRFRHDGLVALRHVDIGEDHVRVVSAASPGASLESTLATTGRLTPDEAVELVLDLLPALEALHGLHQVHQDIRPATVRRTADGRMLLDGVGLWPLFEADLPVLPTDEVAEARLYKAPEQLGIVGDPVGPEADLYAVGALLYRLLTNQTPFEAHREAEVFQRKLTSQILQPSALVEDVPATLDEIVARLLRPRAIDRFRSVEALAQALERYRSGAPIRQGEVFQQIAAEGRLHGRDSERRRLMERLDTLFERRTGSIVILSGPPGVGKTRLVDDVTLEARRRRGLVVRAKAHEADIASPFGIWRDVLAGIGATIPRMEGRARDGFLKRLSAMVGPQGSLLRPFAPWLARHFAGSAEPPPVDPESQRDRLMATLCQVPLALASAESPLCLVLDDLQWVDAATVMLLDLLASTIDRHPLVVLGCTRDMNASGELPRVLAGMSADRLTRIDLSGLTFPATRAFIEERIGNVQGLGDLSQALLRLSDGNPAGLRTLLQEAEFTGVLSLRNSSWTIDTSHLNELLPAQNVVNRIRARVTALGPEAVGILQAAAVWGSGFDPALLSALLPEISRERIIETLVGGERAGLLRGPRRDGPRGYQFTHDSLQESLTFDMPTDRRQALHRKAAEVLSASDASQIRVAQRCAEHLIHADPRLDDLPILEQAARIALEGYAAQGALNLGNAALARLAGRPADDETVVRLKLLIASALTMARLPEEAARLHREVLSARLPPLTLAKAYKELAVAQFTMGRLDEAIANDRRAASELGYRPPALAVLARAREAWRAVREIWWESRRPRNYTLPARHDEQGGVLADVLNHEARTRFFREGKAARLPLLESLHQARRAGNLQAYARILSQTGGQLASALGRPALSRRMLETSVRVAEASGDIGAMALTRATRLMIFGAMGEFDRLDRERPEVEALVNQVGDAWTSALLASYLFDAAMERGRVGDGLQVVTTFGDTLTPANAREFGSAWAHNRGAWVALSVGRPDLARTIVDRTLSMELVKKDRPLLGYVRAWDVQTGLDGGDPERAIQAAEAYLRYLASGPLASRHNAISTYVAARACAGALLEVGPGTSGISLLERILAAGRALARPFPVYRAQTNLVQARLFLLTGRRAAARRLVDRLVATTSGFEPGTLVATEAAMLSSSLAGGAESPEGRRLLRQAFENLRPADHCLMLKRGLSRELGESAEGEAEAERVATALVTTLRIPIPRAQTASIPLSPRTGTSESALELFEWTHASLASVVRGEAPLDALLHPIVRFAGVDLGLLFRFDRVTASLTLLASSPHHGATGAPRTDPARKTCLQAIQTMAPVIENNRVSTDGMLRGSRAAFPIIRAGFPELVLFLSNRSTPGLIDDAKARHIETLVHVLDVAVAVAASDSPRVD